MDLEMTGLSPEADVIIEIATILTDTDLNIVAEGPDLVIRREPEWFQKMDGWNKEHHTKSGLWKAVLESTVTEAEAEEQTLAFIRKHVGSRESPLCGNSVWQDRRFLARYMPKVDAYLHYRLVDVSTLKELGRRWYPQELTKLSKESSSHRALEDIRESIEELRFYRKNIFKNNLIVENNK